jgi:hypothetical protein
VVAIAHEEDFRNFVKDTCQYSISSVNMIQSTTVLQRTEMPTSSVMTPAVAQLVANRAKGAKNGAIQVSGQNQKPILAVPGKDDPMKIEGMTKGVHTTQTEPAEAASPIVRGEMAHRSHWEARGEKEGVHGCVCG